jgi:hypothetical protein
VHALRDPGGLGQHYLTETELLTRGLTTAVPELAPAMPCPLSCSTLAQRTLFQPVWLCVLFALLLVHEL